MENLLTREAVIGLAIFGAILATVGSWMKARGTSGVGPWLYWTGYICTGVSILLFIVIGYRGGYA